MLWMYSTWHVREGATCMSNPHGLNGLDKIKYRAEEGKVEKLANMVDR